MEVHIGNISKKERVLMNALKSPIHFGQLFLPNDFRKDTASKYHYEVGSEMDNKNDLRPIIFMLPRGHAKTKITQASILKDICTFDYDDEATTEPFIVWVAQNKTQSMRNVNFIKNAIETNGRIRYYFGDLSGTGKWTQEELDFKNGSSLICRAGIHGIRGLLKEHLRPNRFVLDDFEYEGNVKTQASRDANSNTVTSIIMPSLDPDIGRLQINQTPVHYDSFIMRIYESYREYIKAGGNAERFGWRVYRKPTSVENPLWPEYWTSDKLHARKEQLRQANELIKWYQEYEMEVSSDETSLFGNKVICYWDGKLVNRNGSLYLKITYLNGEYVNKEVLVYSFLGCDPASDIETRASSYTAFVCIAVDFEYNIYVLNIYRAQNMPDVAFVNDESNFGTANQVMIKSKQFNVRRAGVEKTALSSGVFSNIKNIKENRPIYKRYPVTPLSHGGENKMDRIYNALIGHFNQFKIFIKNDQVSLEREIVEFGEHARTMDLLDALEMAKRVSYKPIIKEEQKQERPKDEWEKLDEWYSNSTADNWKTV